MKKTNCPVCGKTVDMAGMVHCRDCLKKCFDVMADPNDWKAPICAMISPEAWSSAAGIIAESIEFFTATKASCSMVETAYGYRVVVEADGYRNGPAGDF